MPAAAHAASSIGTQKLAGNHLAPRHAGSAQGEGCRALDQRAGDLTSITLPQKKPSALPALRNVRDMRGLSSPDSPLVDPQPPPARISRPEQDSYLDPQTPPGQRTVRLAHAQHRACR